MSQRNMSKKVKEMIGGCCVCSDERGWSENPLVYCDGAGCNVAVHQACYGIVQVPTGPWFCRKCESQERVARVKCELCPQRAGALKRTDAGGWCHVVCALYIPEACFANVQTMEPIDLNAVPPERFNKICYICEEQKRDTKATAGACMQCNRTSCKQYFHVTCAQAQGLLCEVMGSHENVTYCGYCSHHYKKLKNHSNVKTIPAFRPIPNENGTSDSSPEKSNTPKPEMNAKASSNPSLLSQSSKSAEGEKSPQVDQSVSSTSDALPAAHHNGGGNDSGDNAAQVSDVSSAVSPTGVGGGTAADGAGLKSPAESGGGSSDHSIQEPSSSGVGIITTSAIAPKAVLLDKGAASSSTEQLEVDIEEDVGVGLDGSAELLKSPVAGASAAMTKRQRSNSQDKRSKALSKKQKGSNISSSNQERKERLKKAIKKRRDSGGSSQGHSTQPMLHSPTIGTSSLPGHHDYCGNTFGGSPYFQSLGASGRVSMPSFSTNDFSVSGAEPNHLIQPPKMFPSTLSGSTFRNQDPLQDIPLSMEQLLEQQWEQGAQFLMQQGEHFDISSLLNCLHKLKGENQALEEQVKELTSRRNHLMMVNARLSLPLSLYDKDSAAEADGASSATGDGGEGSGISTVPSSLPSRISNSSVASFEDISSPDDIQIPKLAPVRIPSHPGLVVEDIVSPDEPERTSLSLLPSLKPVSEEARSSSTFPYTIQSCLAQPLMYSAVNPPPPSLPAMNTSSVVSPALGRPLSSPLVPPSLTLAMPSSSASSSSLSTMLPLSLALSSSTSSSSPSVLSTTCDVSHPPSLSGLSLAPQTGQSVL